MDPDTRKETMGMHQLPRLAPRRLISRAVDPSWLEAELCACVRACDDTREQLLAATTFQTPRYDPRPTYAKNPQYGGEKK